MNQIVLDSNPKGSGTAALTLASGAAAKSTAKAGGDMFRGALADRLLAAAPVVPTAAKSPEPQTLQTLQAKIGQMFASGASLADVVSTLSAQLAASVAPAAGDAPDARGTLQTVFAKALAPPGNGDEASGSIADRTRALAQRYLRIAAIAQKIAGQPAGQQTRIAGHVLDAQRAKDIPARQTAGSLATAASDNAVLNAVAPSSLGLPHSDPMLQSAAMLQTLAAPQGAPAVQSVPKTASGAALKHAIERNAAPKPTLDHRQEALAEQTAQMTPSGAGPQHVAVPANVAALPNAAVPQNTAPASASRDPSSAGTQTAPEANRDLQETASAPFAPLGTVAAAAQMLPPAAGDSKRVNLGGRIAVATGGDTSLGRTLTRAALAADARAASAPNAGLAPTVDGGTPAEPASPKAALTAFIRSFEAAIKADASAVSGASAPAAAPDGLSAPPAAHAAADAAAPGAQPAAPIADRAPPAQAVAAAVPAAPIDHSAIADQVLRGAFMRTTGTSSEMRLSLLPDSLGSVNVKLVVDAGNVTAHVLAETPEVRDALTAAQPQLSKALADAGLKLTSLRVDLSGNGFAGFSQQQNDRSNGEHPARRVEGVGTADDDEALDAIPSFAPSTARPRAGDYNYLV